MLGRHVGPPDDHRGAPGWFDVRFRSDNCSRSVSPSPYPLPAAAPFGALLSSPPAVAAPEPPPVEAVLPPPPPEDPVVTLIAISEQHFQAGQRELELGHVEGARLEFDKAVNVLLESPYGGRTEPRIREHFDRLVDRISAYEVKALADGDGFTEKKYEPASIDELLAMSATLTPPLASPEVEEAVQNDPVVHDIPIPLNPRVLSFIELFQGRLHDFIQEGHRARQPSTCR